ncbi:molybdopterin guanine dinucleotide-containing S/N-oxide reductase [Alphaproteobacteria bacterium LSUCC0684]
MSDTKTFLTSAHWGSYRAVTASGQLKSMVPFDQDGDPSPIGQGIVDVIEGASRITKPMVRRSWLDGKRGENTDRRGHDAFVALDWGEAIALAGDELSRVISQYGNSAIYAGSYGWASAGRFHHAQGQIHRFLNAIGGYTRSVNTYSFAAAEVIFPHVLGDFRSYLYQQTSWASIIEHCDLFVAFGGIPLKNAQIGQGGIGEHRQKQWMLKAHENGVEFVNVSPMKSDLLEDVSADWMPVRPNSDVAMMLALCYVLIEEDLHDRRFLDRYTTGFEKVEAYLMGEADGVRKAPQWAAEICDIPAETIRHLARRMAAGRTMISMSWSLSRQAFGEQPLWAGVTLAALLGQIGLPGGGFGFGYAAVQTVGNGIGNYSMTAFPQGRNEVAGFIPVARIADMLLNPGGAFQYNGQDLTYPDIRLVYWAGGNPFHHHQDLNRLRKAWQKPDTIIVHEWCWNALAKHADIVLPCTTTLERQDIAMSPRDNYVISMEKAIEPVGDAADDYEILVRLSRHLNIEDRFTEGRSSDEWQRHLYETSREQMRDDGYDLPGYDEFRKRGWFQIEARDNSTILFEEFRKDPVKTPLNTPSGRIELYSATIEGFGYADCPPHASWLEPEEWIGSKARAFPLHLICNQPKTKLHSQLDHGSISRNAKIKGHEIMVIHPHDAGARGIGDGDIVRVHNHRGACLCGAVLSDSIKPGVILIPTGAWFDPANDEGGELSCKHGNPNVLTPDRGTSRLGQGPAAHSCLVEVECWSGGDVAVTAFEPPEIITSKGSS